MENVHFIGLVNNNEIPNYIINYDVCINFPIITQLTEHADYLKLYEYLAAGKPVVSTNVYAARKIKQLVKIATDSQDFIYKIESSLTDRNEKIINDRLRFARENSWKNRAEDMMNIIKKVS